MSNIAGKSYAMNVVSPTKWNGIVNRLIFLAGRTLLKNKLQGLLTLSLIHYARWAIIRPKDFPRLSDDQRRAILDGLVKVMRADDRISSREAEFFNLVVEALHLTAADAAGLVVE